MTTSKSFKHRFFLLSLLIFISVMSPLILRITSSAKADNNTIVQNNENQAADKTSNLKDDKNVTIKVIVYYFYTTHRCYSCRMIEQYTKDAVEKFFKEELTSGLVEFKPLNIEEKGNEHFTKDYKLYTKSVVISLIKEGKEVSYKNLEKVWQYLRNENKFFNYIKEETEKVLREIK